MEYPGLQRPKGKRHLKSGEHRGAARAQRELEQVEIVTMLEVKGLLDRDAVRQAHANRAGARCARGAAEGPLSSVFPNGCSANRARYRAISFKAISSIPGIDSRSLSVTKSIVPYKRLPRSEV
jgi:hypothetical protein